MSRDTLIIHGVDLDLLDKQRLALDSIDPKTLTLEQAEAWDGITEMLDSWADERG